MKLLKKLVSLLTVAAITIGLIGFNTPVYAATADTYISQLIMYYQNYQEEATTDIERVLSEMAEVDVEQAEVWKKIMNYWSEVNSDNFVNVGTVPTELPTDDSVAVVILGFALNDDGTMKDELVGRLQTGLDIAEEYPNSYVVVTGGGTAANNPNVTEGGLMGEWLIEQGLAEDRLIIENQAPDTVGNAENTYAILNENYPNVDSVVLVTSDYHVPRGCLLYNSKFILEAYENNSDPIDIVANAGYNTGSTGYETIKLQANGVRSVAGITEQPTVELSVLTALTVTQNTLYTTGNDLDLTVKAIYDCGYEKYEKDVTDLVTITGFDKTQDASQTVTVSYTDNNVTLTGELTLSDTSKFIIDTSKLEALIAEAEAIDKTKYTASSYAALPDMLQAAKDVIAKTDVTFEELNEAYDKLENAIVTLRPRVNLVTYKKAVTTNATKIADGGIEAITDGDNSTYATFTEPAISDLEIIIELDGYYDLEEIVVRPYHRESDASVRSYFYDLYVSEDGEEWTLVAQHTAKGTKDEGNSHKIDVDVAAKYIKIDGTGKVNPGTQTNQAFHLSEVYAYGEEVKNIILGKPFTSSGADTTASSSATATTVKAVDGDRRTYWDAGKYKYNPWLDVDLGDIYSLDSVNVITYVGSGRYYQFEVYASTDGVNYTKIAEKTDSVEPTIYGTTFEFAESVYASHLKVVGTYNSKNSAFHIGEFRAYGELATEEDFIVIAKQELQALIDSTDNIDKSVYTEDSLQSYLLLREEALALINSENATLTEIEEMKSKIQNVLVVDVTVVAKQELEAFIHSTYRSGYTEDSWQLYLPIREEALTLINSENATLAEIEEMKSKIQDVLVYGNPDEKEEGTFRVGSFNIWAPNPDHPDVEAINNMLLRCEIDYAGLQEVDKNNTRDNRDVLKLIADDDFYYNYNKSIDYRGGEYGIGQLSTTEILEVSGGSYTKIADEEGRSWMRMLVEVDGEQVAIYNTHLSLRGVSAEAQASNISEILEIMEADPCKYKFLTADFNATGEYMDPFKEDYNLANGNDGLWYSTFGGDQYHSGLGYLEGAPSADITSGIDNIVYSRNMEISNVRVVYNEGLSDHHMIYADFKLLAYEEDLQELIDSLNYVEEYYTEKTWETYSKELEEAKALLANTDYTELQDELKAAITELQEAIAGLVEKADKTDLENAFEAVKALEKEDYTVESWEAYEEALKAAEEVYQNEEATQEEVDAAIEALAGAIAGLKTVDEEVEVPSVDTDKKDDIANGKDDTNTTSPSTGDSSMIMTYVMMMVACVLVLAAKKRRA